MTDLTLPSHEVGCECPRCKTSIVKTEHRSPAPTLTPEREKPPTDYGVGRRLICCRCGYGQDAGHPWIQRRTQRPRQCWKCKSPYWDRERVRQRKERGPETI